MWVEDEDCAAAVSNQLLKEMNVLEIQFQIERSCRESAEALAVQVTKENKVLKRRSQMLMPLIPEMPENLSDMTFDPETDPAVNGDVVDSGESSNEETLLLQSQAKIAELQASVDSLLAEKLQLEQQVEVMSRDQAQLREQLALEVEEKEAILRRMNKQSKTMNKIKRVSQLVTEEFTEMSQKLELEQGLRQQAEVFAHQMFVQQTVTDGPSMMQMQSSDTGLQLQKALEQISTINTALCDIQRYYQDQMKQSQSSVDDSSFLSELQNLRVQLKKSEEERKALETQLSEANSAFTKVQDEDSAPAPNLKTKAIDEMMERIKKGIVLRPTSRIQDDDGSWKVNPQPGQPSAPVVSDVPWAGERGNAPVLRRLKQNREKRDSRIRASALIVGQEH
eukprot:superscaffoldBa00006023_g21040